MAKKSSDPVHCWLIWRKAHESASDYLYRGITETGISDTDFRVLEVLLHKGPLPVNTIGPKVHLTPGSISVAVDRLLEKGLVSRAESLYDRRVRVVALTKSGKDLIVPIFRKHSAEIARMFADANPKELQILEAFSKRPASAPVRWLRKGPSRTTRPGVASHSLELRRFKQLLRGVMQRLEQNMIEPAHATNFERFEDQKNPRKRWRFLLNRKAALKTRDIVCLN